MSTVPALQSRPALGLPAGSVRSILALLVVALVCAILLIPSDKELLPPYLLYLLFLILGHFFATLGAHGPSGHSSPLYLPKAFVRLLIIGALAATIGWKLYSDPDDLARKWAASMELVQAQWFMPLVLLGGFFVGVLLRSVVGRDNPPIMIQDFEAWLALIAVAGLLIMAIIHLVITLSPSISSPISLPKFEGFLAALIAFYFGARS